jgi:cell fate regulator YaaT (PSP1 superfamily)
LLDTTLETDAIFGNIAPSQPAKKEKPASVEPIEIRELSNEELFGTDHILYTPKASAEATVEIVGVRFKAGGKVYYFNPNGIKFSRGNFAILDTARGVEFGEICIPNRFVSEKDIVAPLQKVLRRATNEDIEKNQLNKKKEKEAFKICLEKIAQHKLDMKLVDVQCAFDNSKYLFYFTSAGRVDFRELVRDLASQFKTRIELRQIGIRDEAKLIGGIGICGRPICCSRHLSNFAQVSIKMAKEQGLSLSSNKISGNCGRLMCCLNFENQTYVDEIKRTPMPGSTVKVDGKLGNVTDANPLTGRLKVHLSDAPDGETVVTHRDQVVIISKKGGAEPTEDTEEKE